LRVSSSCGFTPDSAPARLFFPTSLPSSAYLTLGLAYKTCLLCLARAKFETPGVQHLMLDHPVNTGLPSSGLTTDGHRAPPWIAPLGTPSGNAPIDAVTRDWKPLFFNIRVCPQHACLAFRACYSRAYTSGLPLPCLAHPVSQNPLLCRRYS
jgi:hypothetical protein